MPAPHVRRDAGRRLEHRRERPHRQREVADGEVVPNHSLLASALDQLLEQREDQPPPLGDAGAAAVAEEEAPQREVAGLQAEHVLEERDQADPRVLGGGGRLGRGDHLLDVLGEDLLGERFARREVAIERADPDAGAAGDLLERGVGALLGEDLAAGSGQLGAVPGGIAAQLRHVLKVAETEGASVSVSEPRNHLAGPRVPTADERRSHAAHHPVAIALALLATLVLAGCGGGGGY